MLYNSVYEKIFNMFSIVLYNCSETFVPSSMLLLMNVWIVCSTRHQAFQLIDCLKLASWVNFWLEWLYCEDGVEKIHIVVKI